MRVKIAPHLLVVFIVDFADLQLLDVYRVFHSVLVCFFYELVDLLQLLVKVDDPGLSLAGALVEIVEVVLGAALELRHISFNLCEPFVGL